MPLFRNRITGIIVDRPAHYAENEKLSKKFELITEQKAAVNTLFIDRMKKLAGNSTEPVSAEPEELQTPETITEKDEE